MKLEEDKIMAQTEDACALTLKKAELWELYFSALISFSVEIAENLFHVDAATDIHDQNIC